MEIEGGAYSEHQARIEKRQVAGHEELLLGAAEADPDDVGFEFGNGGDKFILLSAGEAVEGWHDRPNNAHRGEVPCKPVAEFGGYAFGPAIEEVGDVGEFRAAKDLEHEIWAGDALHGAVALETANPRERCSIGEVELRGSVCLGNLTRALGFQHAMHACETDIALTSLVQHDGYVRERGFHVEGIDIDTENVSERPEL